MKRIDPEEAALQDKLQRQFEMSQDVIRQIQAETGDSPQWGGLLAQYDDLSGGGMGNRTDLSQDQKDKYRQVKGQLEDAFGRQVLDVFDEWKRAEGVRNAVLAEGKT